MASSLTQDQGPTVESTQTSDWVSESQCYFYKLLLCENSIRGADKTILKSARGVFFLAFWVTVKKHTQSGGILGRKNGCFLKMLGRTRKDLSTPMDFCHLLLDNKFAFSFCLCQNMTWYSSATLSISATLSLVCMYICWVRPCFLLLFSFFFSFHVVIFPHSLNMSFNMSVHGVLSLCWRAFSSRLRLFF